MYRLYPDTLFAHYQQAASKNRLLFNLIYTHSFDDLNDTNLVVHAKESGLNLIAFLKKHNIFVAIVNLGGPFINEENRQILATFAKKSTFKNYIRSIIEINTDYKYNVLNLLNERGGCSEECTKFLEKIKLYE